MLKAIRFLSSVSLYRAGEIAGFEPNVADHYVTSGQAEPYPPTPTPVDDKGLDQAPADKQMTPGKTRASPRTK